MQDAFSQDMFNLSDINSSRCNGHVPFSTTGKVPTKRDRKGCKKGKIEAIMKNNFVSSKPRTKIQTSPVVKKFKPIQSVTNHAVKPGALTKSEYIDSDDPYTFTETEPQIVTLHPNSNNLTLSRKLVPLISNRSNQLFVNKNGINMVCVDRESELNKANKTLADLKAVQSAELPSKPFVSKVTKNIHSLEGSSKTMNKLQADIARNKLIGKRKKMVVNNKVVSEWEDKVIKTEPNSNQHSSPTVFAKVSVPAKRLLRQTTWQRERKSRHEALLRMQQTQQQVWDLNHDLYPLGLELSDSEGEEDSRGVFQRHWFMGCVWGSVGCGSGGRESRLAQVSSEMRRRMRQVWRNPGHCSYLSHDYVTSIVDAARTHPISTALLLHPNLKFPSRPQSRAVVSMLVPQKCSLECERPALPCTRHCAQHIMYNVDQLLFQHCTAKFSDNTQCCVPVFDISHHHPLCPKHAAAFDNAMKADGGSKPKKCSRKKSKPLALSRSAKRGKKKKKPRTSLGDANEVEMPEVEVKTEPMMVEEVVTASDTNHMDQIMLHSSGPTEVFLTNSTPVSQVEIQVQLEDAVEVVSDEVLAIASLDPTELANQASRLLEEHDITSMLNQIPPDAFTDIFLEDKNGEFGPTREQTEGLERALEEVDKEVRTLERMSLSLPLDPINLLDDVGGYVTYPNGFTTIPATTHHS